MYHNEHMKVKNNMGKQGNQLIKGFLLFVIIGARLTMRSFLENIVTYITLFLLSTYFP